MTTSDTTSDTPRPEAPDTTPEAPEKAPRKRRPLWRRILKWTSITIGSVLLLLILAFCVLLFYLTPERLTPLVNRYASEYLNADFHASRVELTFWSTFPRLNVQIDNVDLVSRSLRVLPERERATLPADADLLLRLRRFSGGVNMLSLLTGNIDLYDVEFTDPSINMFVYNDSINNFDILPPSDEDEEPSPIPEML